MGEGFKIQRQLPIFDTNIYLYNEGDERTALTGGWSAVTTQGSATETKNADNLYVVCTSFYSAGMFVTANTVDLTNYSKIKIEYKGSSQNGWCCLGVGSSKTLNAHLDNNTAGLVLATSAVKATAEIDISSINSSLYIKFGTGSGGTAPHSYGNAYKMWLEV